MKKGEKKLVEKSKTKAQVEQGKVNSEKQSGGATARAEKKPVEETFQKPEGLANLEIDIESFLMG